MGKSFLAVDWGTTNRRIYHIENGELLATTRDDLGARAMRPGDYPAEIEALRARFGDLPMLLAGMVGSSIGWHVIPYAAVPTGLDSLAAALHWIDDRTAIVPGVVQSEPADVMRGEEVQLLGAAAANIVSDDAFLCQPGTHCKWVHLANGSIASFSTAMTGELFHLLRTSSILAPDLAGDVTDAQSFLQGVMCGANYGLQTELFRIRARGLSGARKDMASFASGLLIGDDVRWHIDSGPVHLLADASLGALYRAAIHTLGGEAHLVDSHAAFIAGITRIAELSL